MSPTQLTQVRESLLSSQPKNIFPLVFFLLRILCLDVSGIEGQVEKNSVLLKTSRGYAIGNWAFVAIFYLKLKY